MSTTKSNDDLFQTSHLTLLISYTIFAIILIVESLLLGWEKWAIIPSHKTQHPGKCPYLGIRDPDDGVLFLLRYPSDKHF